MSGIGMARSPMGKFCFDRSVCAPQYRDDSTAMAPNESFSNRVCDVSLGTVMGQSLPVFERSRRSPPSSDQSAPPNSAPEDTVSISASRLRARLTRLFIVPTAQLQTAAASS